LNVKPISVQQSVLDGQWSVVSGRYPAVVVHSLADARRVLVHGAPVTLLSGEAAALYAGCGWWRALTAAARAEFPVVPIADLLDCGDASGQALAAVRIGLRHLILSADAPGRAKVAAIVDGLCGVLLAERPPALDLANPANRRRLHEWMQVRTGPDW
jgi:hypothetical protein